jgi:hypothetical protein
VIVIAIAIAIVIVIVIVIPIFLTRLIHFEVLDVEEYLLHTVSKLPFLL